MSYKIYKYYHIIRKLRENKYLKKKIKSVKSFYKKITVKYNIKVKKNTNKNSMKKLKK